jgi:hypothetical protein
MSDYFTAYRKRLERNDKDLRSFADKLKQNGFTVLASKGKTLLSLIYARKGGMQTIIGFAEVPYRWYIDNEFSGLISYVNTLTHGHIADREFNFTVKDVEERLTDSIDKRFESHKEEI